MKISFVELENYYPIKIAKWLENAFRRFESVEGPEMTEMHLQNFVTSRPNHAEGVYIIRNLLRYITNTKCCISSSRREYTLARDEIQPQRG